MRVMGFPMTNQADWAGSFWSSCGDGRLSGTKLRWPTERRLEAFPSLRTSIELEPGDTHPTDVERHVIEDFGRERGIAACDVDRIGQLIQGLRRSSAPEEPGLAGIAPPPHMRARRGGGRRRR